MRRSLYKPLVCIFITTICMATQCRKDKIFSYNFSEKIDLYPEQKIYQLGDTIWLQHTNAANTLYDSHSNQYFSVDTLCIGFGTSGSTDYNLPDDPTNIFCNYIFNGINVGATPYFVHTFGCTNGGTFNFKVGMVLNKTGTFSIRFGTGAVTSCSSTGVYINGVGLPYSNISYKFNVADGNKDIYLSITPARRGSKEDTYQLIDDKEIFFFKVE